MNPAHHMVFSLHNPAQWLSCFGNSLYFPAYIPYFWSLELPFVKPVLGVTCYITAANPVNHGMMLYRPLTWQLHAGSQALQA